MLVAASRDDEPAGETAEGETQVDRPAFHASSEVFQVRGSWSGIQWFPTGDAGAHTQSGVVGTAILETFQMLGAFRICGT